MESATQPLEIHFETDPSRYRHLQLELQGPVAWLKLNIQEDKPQRPGYALKLNSYDLGVDIELADAVNRLRFEHPEVACVVVTSAQPGVFSAGANIFMLGTSSHAFKVNFCKYTNETRLSIEDATAHSGQTYIAALNGIASGGGYELALACQEIYLIDDRRSAVALPEVPYLGVLPGTGGLTRVVDKRKVRRDHADIFCTLAEGVKGKRAADWALVDGVYASSKFQAEIEARAKAIAGEGKKDRKGITLEPLAPEVSAEGLRYRHVSLKFGPTPRTATLEIQGPQDVAFDPKAPSSSFYALRMFRELDDALLRLRFNYPETGLILIKTVGDSDRALALDREIDKHKDHWLMKEITLYMKRVLKRLDLTARSFFALIEEGSCFAGSLFELALAADRSYMRESDKVSVAISPMNAGLLPMSNGLTRLQTRFLANPAHAESLMREPRRFGAEEAQTAGLVTQVVDALDWDDEVRLAIEERASMSPDALTGLEANLRFAGPETLETKIFGRLSAWQNWIFQRPNAVGEKGALHLYGRPESPVFDWNRT